MSEEQGKSITTEQFAKCAARGKQVFKESWDQAAGVSTKSLAESVGIAMREQQIAQVWYWPIVLFMLDGFAEADCWIEENGK